MRFANRLAALPLRRKIQIAALLPLVPALIAASLGFALLARATHQQGFELAASAQLEAAEALLRLVVDAETGERGFVLTGDERFLEPFEDALEEFPERANVLARSLGGDVELRERLRRVESNFAAWRDEVALPLVEARRAIPGRAPVPEAWRAAMAEITERIARQEGKRRTDAIRREVAAFQTAGRARVAASLAATAGARRDTLELLVVAGALAVALVAWSAAVVGRRATSSLARLREAAAAITAGHLDERAPEEGGEEIAAVAASFNAMADRIRKRRAERDARQELSDLLQGCSTLEEAAAVVSTVGPRIVTRGSGFAYTITASRSDVVLAARFGEPAEPAPAEFAPEECWALRRAHRYEVRSGGLPLCAHASAGGGDSLCLPLASQGEIFGLLHYRAPAGTSAPEVDELFAAVTVIGLDFSLAGGNLRLRQTLRDQSIRDPLTGLFNRRYFDETFERELQRARRTRRPIALLMADLDHFKRFNDQFGHEAGDLVLKEVGTMLRETFRGVDVPCRMGGEELAVLLPDSELAAVNERVTRLLESLRSRDLALRSQQLGRVTLSAGLASFPEHGATAADLVHAADRALYEAKRGGRDRLVVAS